MRVTPLRQIALCTATFGATLLSWSLPARAQDPAGLPHYATLHDGTQNKNAIPLPEAMMGFFGMVLSIEESERGGGANFLEDAVGLDARSAEELFHYIRRAMDAINLRGLELNEQMCSRRESLVDRLALTREIMQMERLHRLDVEVRTYGISEALRLADSEKVLAWVDENLRPTIKMVTFDREKQIETLDPREAVGRMCDRPQGVQVSRGN